MVKSFLGDLLMEFKTILDEVKKIILKHANPERINLYGSRVSCEAKEGSDIDIAYDAPDFRDNHLIEEEVRCGLICT